MTLALLVGISACWMLTGVFIFVDPVTFYELTPGLKPMGPFNIHFIRDAGLAFLASGCALCWGSWRSNPSVALAGITWPALHAMFHVQIWLHRGLPLDRIFFFDLTLVMGPPVLALFLVSRTRQTAT